MFEVRELLEKVITEKNAFEVQIVHTQYSTCFYQLVKFHLIGIS